MKARLRREQLGLQTPTQALLSELYAVNSVYTVAHQAHPESQQLQRLFFCHQNSSRLLEASLEVVLADCTYKSNRFHLPLLAFVGVTVLNTSFYIAFAFLSKEEIGDYEWALLQLQKLYQNMLSPRDGPDVIITDCDTGLIAACQRVIPSTN
jgi:hypothetical protein